MSSSTGSRPWPHADSSNCRLTLVCNTDSQYHDNLVNQAQTCDSSSRRRTDLHGGDEFLALEWIGDLAMALAM